MVGRSFQLLTLSKIFPLSVDFQVRENCIKGNQFVSARDKDFLIYLPRISLGLCSLILRLKNEFGFKIKRFCFVIFDIFFIRILLTVTSSSRIWFSWNYLGLRSQNLTLATLRKTTNLHLQNCEILLGQYLTLAKFYTFKVSEVQ